VFEDELVLNRIWVYGEAEDCTYAKGSLHFTLTDGQARIACVKFGALPQDKPTAGDEVAVLGTVSYYPKGGRVTLKVTAIERSGKGRRLAELNALKDVLRGEGLFENRPTPPRFIQSVGVVTSGAGAVIHDMLSVFERRHRYLKLTVERVRVQGGGAEADIAAALCRINQNSAKPDVIILARGGGSAADLAAFNTEKAARAVAASRIPVISAVGHETDYTLCDFCAGTRAGTPSLAAERVAAVNDACLSGFYALTDRLSAGAAGCYGRARRRMRTAMFALQKAGDRIYYRGRASVTAKYTRMTAALTAGLSGSERRIGTLAARLDALSPLKLLAGGYARVSGSDGRALLTSKGVRPGDTVDIRLNEGGMAAQVRSVWLPDTKKTGRTEKNSAKKES
jgi:exodeoxyribonuclease VII large subunit